MVDSEYSSNDYKTLKTNIGAIIRDPEVLRFDSDHLKTKQMRKNAVEKLPFVIKYASNCYKTKERLFISDWYKD